MNAKLSNALGLIENHVAGRFEWEVEPTCSCGRLIEAVNDSYVFVSNFIGDGGNTFYIRPLQADGGQPHHGDGVPIKFCPWCGDSIRGRKRYPTP